MKQQNMQTESLSSLTNEGNKMKINGIAVKVIKMDDRNRLEELLELGRILGYSISEGIMLAYFPLA